MKERKTEMIIIICLLILTIWFTAGFLSGDAQTTEIPSNCTSAAIGISEKLL